MCGRWLEKNKDWLLPVAAIGGAAVGGPPLLAALGLGGTTAAAAGGAGGGLLGAGSEMALLGSLEGAGAGAFIPPATAGGGLLGGGLKNFGRAAYLAQMAGGGEQPPQPSPMQPPGQTIPAGMSAPSIADTNPVDVIDPEKRRRLAMMQQMYGGYRG